MVKSFVFNSHSCNISITCFLFFTFIFSLEYLNTAIFGQTLNGTASSTREVFISLLRSFYEAHAAILETGGTLTTLTAAVILPLKEEKGKFVLCCCNVGDSLGYVYSKTYGVREITKGNM